VGFYSGWIHFIFPNDRGGCNHSVGSDDQKAVCLSLRPEGKKVGVSGLGGIIEVLLFPRVDGTIYHRKTGRSGTRFFFCASNGYGGPQVTNSLVSAISAAGRWSNYGPFGACVNIKCAGWRSNPGRTKVDDLCFSSTNVFVASHCHRTEQ